MSETPVMALPLLAPSQAQKHVTVNEALTRLDGLAQLTLLSVARDTPPATVVDGAVYAVPPGGQAAWAGQDGRIAIAINGGWDFVPPHRGWRAFVVDEGGLAVFDGSNWRVGSTTMTQAGAGAAIRSVEFDVQMSAAVQITTQIAFPSRSIALGVTGRVVDALTGSLSSWDLGVAGDTGRYGTGLGTALNSWVDGPGTPLVYWSPTALDLTANGGAFASGTVRLVAHYMILNLPDQI